MPKVKSFAGPWLSPGAPGGSLFAPDRDPRASSQTALPFSSRKTVPSVLPRRTIALRGTEVFVAVGREIRWADLAWLKEKYDESVPAIKREREDSPGPFDDLGRLADALTNSPGLRIIKTPVADDINQLVISPNSSCLAILTTHTVHICLIPDSSHLSSDDTSPIRARIWTLGPTTHITSRSPIASAVWHPLGVNGCCVVTVTTDAIVRVWELSLTDRWSFDSATLSVDLRKLVDGTAADQDFSASAIATNVSFSPDSVDMRVSAAAFASRGSGRWCPMTLWVAMREGDMYALCPLLPQRWAPPPTLLPSLAAAVKTKVAVLESDDRPSEQDRLLAQQQLEWMDDVDGQEPLVGDSALGEYPSEVYVRPARPGAVPRLQGPFQLKADPVSEDELDLRITDMLVIGGKTDMAEVTMAGASGGAGALTGAELEDYVYGVDQEGLSLTVVCLLTTSGQVRAYLDMDGVEAQWLPPRFKSRRPVLADTARFLTIQCIDTMAPFEVLEDSWPLFSTDVTSRYSFFVTHHAGITHISLASWVLRLESDLAGESEAGSDFRLGLLAVSQAVRDRLYSCGGSHPVTALAAAVVVRDPDVGYLLLAATAGGDAITLTFETPEDDPVLRQQAMMPVRGEFPVRPLDFYEPRPAYHVSAAFNRASELPALLARLRTSRHKTAVKQAVRLSPLTLQVFTDAHQLLSEETHQVGLAVSELFRRCGMILAELQQQIVKVGVLRNKVDQIAGRDVAEGRGPESDNQRIETRMVAASRRQQALAKRLESVRATVGKAAASALSDKERAWMDEVRVLQAEVLSNDRCAGAGAGSGTRTWKRLQDVEQLRAELTAEAEKVRQQLQRADGAVAATNKVQQATVMAAAAAASAAEDLRIPHDIRKARLQSILGLLDRETALVEAISSRLEQLQLNMASA